MRVTTPAPWIDALILSSNIPEPDTGESVYNAGTTYMLGAEAYDAATHRRYRSKVAGNLGNPLTDTTKWQFRGSTNRWGMFDATVGSSSSRATPITVTVKFSNLTQVVLLGLSGATSVTFTQRQSGGGAVIETRTVAVDELYPPVDWFEYWFTDPVYKDSVVVNNFAPITDAEMTVSITAPSGVVTCGTMLVGVPIEVGPIKFGVTAGFDDFGQVARDSDTGLSSYTSAAIVKNQSGQIVVNNGAADSVLSRLRAAQGKPVYIEGGGDYNALNIFGQLSRVKLAFSSNTLSYISYDFLEL